MEALDRAILTTLEQDVLHPAVISKPWRKPSSNFVLRTTTQLCDGR